jgi:ADP-ribose pyrophosphatase
MTEIETVSSTVVYENRWMTVREDQIRRSDGSAGLYGVVSKPDFALVLPWYDGGFQLVEQYRYPVGERLWEFPQGSWSEDAEADPVELARGELSEETGLVAGSMQELAYIYASYGYSSQGCHVMLATDLTPGPTKLDAEEVGLISRRFSVEDTWQLIADGRLRDGPSIAALGLFTRSQL